MPKKILIVTEVFYPEEFKINDVALSWKDKGYDVDVLTLTPTYPLGKVFPGYKNWFFKKDEYNGISIYRLRAVSGYKSSSIKKIFKYINFMFFGGIAAIIIGRKYDYVFGFNISSLTDMFPAVLISKLYNKPTMFWVQDIWPGSVYAYGFKKSKILSTFLDAFVKFMHHNIDAIAISSKGFESKIKPYSKEDMNFIYAPNWADDLNMNLEPFILCKDEKVHFTFAGNIGKMQNLENIIKAFSLLSGDSQHKAQLNIFGDGSNLTDLKLLANNNKNIVFHGIIERNQMAKVYKASDFLIVSLIDEPVFEVTIPAKMQTYIAAKKPILAIINGEVADIVVNNNLGISVDPSNLELIKNSLLACIEMPLHEKLEFIKNSDDLIHSTFNKVHIIDNLTSTLVNVKKKTATLSASQLTDSSRPEVDSLSSVIASPLEGIKSLKNIPLSEPFFSIITVNLNSGKEILNTINSIKDQSFKNFEHIVIDGLSKDISYEMLLDNLKSFDFFSSEKDDGIYDAINKGITNAKGEYLILLHSGDFFSDKYSLKNISAYIVNNPSYDVYLSDVIIGPFSTNSNSFRYYPSDVFTTSRMRLGIMPPHPAMFFKREMHEKIGLYSTKYKIAGDFDFIVRMFQTEGLTHTSCNKVFINMQAGGLSDKFSNKILLHKEILDICRNRNLQTNHFLLLLRYLIKLPEVIPILARSKRYLKPKMFLPPQVK